MNTIPEFPNCVPLEFEHISTIQSALKAQGIRSADYSFYYLTGWNHYKPTCVARIGQRLVFIVQKGKNERLFLGPFGVGPVKSAVEKLLSCAATDFGQQENVLRYVPGALANEIKSELTPIKIETERNYFDYLYYRHELACLEGHKFAKRRNQLSKIQRESSAEVFELSENDISYVLKCLDSWYERYSNGDQTLLDERESVKIALPNLWKMGGKGIRVRVQNEMCGITWAVPITDDVWLVPIEKASREIKGMYQYVNWALANSLPPCVKILNRECDLGIEGLRIAKERYNPMGFEEKYTLWFKPFSG